MGRGKQMAAAAGLILAATAVIAGYLWWGYSREKSIDFEGKRRNYRIHLPAGAQSGPKLPLVIVLHAYGDFPRLVEMYSQFSRKADAEKFIVSYPYGTKSRIDPGLSWNAGWCCASALVENSNDTGFINRLIDELIRLYPVDPSRVYLAGISNGAMMAAQAAAADPSKIAALGLVAGTIGGQSPGSRGYIVMPKMARPMPVIMFHGESDIAAPIGGGASLVYGLKAIASFESYASSMEFFFRENRCRSWKTSTTARGVRTDEAQGCADNTSVRAFRIPERGHIWFGWPMESLIYGSTKGISATDEMWKFFSGYRRN